MVERPRPQFHHVAQKYTTPRFVPFNLAMRRRNACHPDTFHLDGLQVHHPFGILTVASKPIRHKVPIRFRYDEVAIRISSDECLKRFAVEVIGMIVRRGHDINFRQQAGIHHTLSHAHMRLLRSRVLRRQ